MGRIERAPSWILEYKERIEKGAITAEDILEAENKIREMPIKISSVTRAINAMGHPIIGLRREKKGDNIKETIKDQSPSWLQKYRNKIEKGAIPIKDILEAENMIREVPIKITTVLRAINIMGYPVTELRRGKKIEAEVQETKLVEKKEVPTRGPSWLQKYRDGIEEGTITVEDIREAENRIRAMPIKISTVTRAINTMGYPITELQRGTKDEERKKEKRKKAVGVAEEVAYSSDIEKISKATEKRFIATKRSWEEYLGKSLQNDYFMNLLLVLAKLLEHGKTLAPAKK